MKIEVRKGKKIVVIESNFATDEDIGLAISRNGGRQWIQPQVDEELLLMISEAIEKHLNKREANNA